MSVGHVILALLTSFLGWLALLLMLLRRRLLLLLLPLLFELSCSRSACDLLSRLRTATGSHV